MGDQRDPANEFKQVYSDFQTFVKDKSKGRQVVFVAHNAKFDLRMMNGELRRWRLEDAATAPSLADIFSTSVDTLALFRERKWWGSNFGRETQPPRPSSFSLSALHSHVLNESVNNAHNAVGDIDALERLLLSDTFDGWQKTANKLQVPFVKPSGR